MAKKKKQKTMADNVFDQLQQDIMNDAFVELLELTKRHNVLHQIADIVITENLPDELLQKRKKTLSSKDFATINEKLATIDKQIRRVEAMLKMMSIMFVFHDEKQEKEDIITALAILLDIFKSCQTNVNELQNYMEEAEFSE